MENNIPSENYISRKLLIVNGMLVAICILLVFTIYSALHQKKPAKAPEPAATAAQTAMYFDSLALHAKAVYVYDLTGNKVLYEKNELAQLPLASLTKL